MVSGVSWRPLATKGFLRMAHGLHVLSLAMAISSNTGSVILCFLFCFFGILVWFFASLSVKFLDIIGLLMD
jgi:hypothetical protein